MNKLYKYFEKGAQTVQILWDKPYLTNKPRYASPETQEWLYNLAFLEEVLKQNQDARTSFLEIVVLVGSNGMQSICNDAKKSNIDPYKFAAKLMDAKYNYRGDPKLSKEAPILKEYDRKMKNGSFDNRDYITLVDMMRHFIKEYCNSFTDYYNDTCKVTIEKSKLLYSSLMFKAIWTHFKIDPQDIDNKQFSKDLNDIAYGNPTENYKKKAKTNIIHCYNQLKWELHNDGVYTRRAEIYYRAKVANPGSVIKLADEIARKELQQRVNNWYCYRGQVNLHIGIGDIWI